MTFVVDVPPMPNKQTNNKLLSKVTAFDSLIKFVELTQFYSFC